jgi:hypothetical protein
MPPEAREILDAAPELNFLSHFIFKVFERTRDNALRVEVRFSAGANENPMDFYHIRIGEEDVPEEEIVDATTSCESQPEIQPEPEVGPAWDESIASVESVWRPMTLD